MKKKLLLYLFCLSILFACTKARLALHNQNYSPAFDLNLYKKVLDPELCQQQINFITWNNTFILQQMLDASIRFPRGFFEGNTEDLGQYQQCLRPSMERTNIDGKYCLTSVPMSQNLPLPIINVGAETIDINSLSLSPVNESDLKAYNLAVKSYRALSGSGLDERSNIFSGVVLTLAICIPSVCTSKEFINGLLFNITDLGFQFNDIFCRMIDDKPWVPADYVAIAVFSFIGCLTILSTAYELTYIIVLKRDSKRLNVYYRSFSVYNNTRRLVNYSKGIDSLSCLDGIRTLATMWVIIGHAFSTMPSVQNPIKAWTWMTSASALWITAAPITVDTFIVITGILLVFTTARKLNGKNLIRNLHLFYLNRLLRMFPLLATAVLLDASLFHKIADGPIWTSVANNAERCRAFWWTTLLHVQNYLNPMEMCLSHSWYIAIDVQLHLLSPILLFWLLNSRRQAAWSALVIILSAALGGSAIYNYFMALPSHTVVPSRGQEMIDYLTKYYFHIMSRITPFLVGMTFGYVLHIWRDKKMKINLITVICLWALSFGIIGLTLYTLYSVKQLDWDNQALDTAINTLMRPAWAAAIGWMVLACVQGYGGIINWFLSLPMWQIPGRICYGMYLFHYPIMFVASGTALAPIYFQVGSIMFQALSHIMMTFIVAFTLTVVIDSPFAVIFKHLLDKGHRTLSNPKKLEELIQN